MARLVRYIHLNPVRAGIVSRPENYKWSGHNAYLGFDPIVWVERDYVLKRYSEEREIAIRRYHEFILSGIGVEPEIDFNIGIQSGIIGDDTFIQEIIEREDDIVDINKVKFIELTVDKLIDRLCARYGVSPVEICSQNRGRNLANIRAVLASMARDLEGLSIKELAKVLRRDPSGLSRLGNNLDRKCRNSPQLRQEIESLRIQLLNEY